MVSVSLSTKDIQILKYWMGPTAVSTMLSPWVHDLLIYAPKNTIKAAAMVGTSLSDIVRMGQVSHEHAARIVDFPIKTPKFALSLHKFGHECCMTSKASILRTAIMLGLGLPRIELGVMSQTRENPFSRDECLVIIDKAKSLFPREPL